jgi:hypothetical protein
MREEIMSSKSVQAGLDCKVEDASMYQLPDGRKAVPATGHYNPTSGELEES